MNPTVCSLTSAYPSGALLKEGAYPTQTSDSAGIFLFLIYYLKLVPPGPSPLTEQENDLSPSYLAGGSSVSVSGSGDPMGEDLRLLLKEDDCDQIGFGW